MHKLILICGAISAAACGASHVITPDEDAGTSTTMDGSIIVPVDDGGTIVLPDGHVIFPGDSAIAIEPDARVILPDGRVIDPRDAGTTTRGRIGTPCHTDSDCPGLFCSPAGSGFGYCSWVCAEGMPCPEDAVCAVFSAGSIGYCMPPCDPAASTCASGTLCLPGIAERPVCYPGCGSDLDCPVGQMCGRGASGVRQCNSVIGEVGDPCATTGECPEAGYCLDESSWGAPGGICVTFCDLGTLAGCDTGTTCVPWGGDGIGSCVPSCDDMTPCRDGYACVPTGRPGDNACVARCTSSEQCHGVHECNFVTGRCS